MFHINQQFGRHSEGILWVGRRDLGGDYLSYFKLKLMNWVIRRMKPPGRNKKRRKSIKQTTTTSTIIMLAPKALEALDGWARNERKTMAKLRKLKDFEWWQWLKATSDIKRYFVFDAVSWEARHNATGTARKIQEMSFLSRISCSERGDVSIAPLARQHKNCFVVDTLANDSL